MLRRLFTALYVLLLPLVTAKVTNEAMITRNRSSQYSANS